MANDRERRIIMTRKVARRWILKQAAAEFRFKVYGAGGIRHLPNLMKDLRDGKVAMENVDLIPDLGIKEGFDSLEFWSGSREKLSKLHIWFETRGYETTGVW